MSLAEWFKGHLGRYFHRHGLFCSSHPFLVMYLTAAGIIMCSYPAVRLLDAHLSLSLAGQPLYEPIHFWNSPGATLNYSDTSSGGNGSSAFSASDQYLRIDQILVSMNYGLSLPLPLLSSLLLSLSHSFFGCFVQMTPPWQRRRRLKTVGGGGHLES